VARLQRKLAHSDTGQPTNWPRACPGRSIQGPVTTRLCSAGRDPRE
jgi:hypothetical protein